MVKYDTLMTLDLEVFYDKALHMTAESAITKEIQVEARSLYVKEQSNPGQSEYFFKYKIKITNRSPNAVQLISRYWHITDGHGRVQEVRGEGVIGEQPLIVPGQSYEYSSFCPLMTPTGVMKGHYQMIDSTGAHVEVQIPRFFLIEPSSFN
jgi:ApaG protein